MLAKNYFQRVVTAVSMVSLTAVLATSLCRTPSWAMEENEDIANTSTRRTCQDIPLERRDLIFSFVIGSKPLENKNDLMSLFLLDKQTNSMMKRHLLDQVIEKAKGLDFQCEFAKEAALYMKALKPDSPLAENPHVAYQLASFLNKRGFWLRDEHSKTLAEAKVTSALHLLNPHKLATGVISSQQDEEFLWLYFMRPLIFKKEYEPLLEVEERIQQAKIVMATLAEEQATPVKQQMSIPIYLLRLIALTDRSLSPKERVTIFKMGADQGDKESQYQLAMAYVQGFVTDEEGKQLEKGILFSALAKQQSRIWNTPYEDIRLSVVMEPSDGWDQALPLFILAANQGHPDAQAMLGHAYELGFLNVASQKDSLEEVRKDSRIEAKRWFELAAAQNQTDALFHLSSFQHGLLKKAARLNHPMASVAYYNDDNPDLTREVVSIQHVAGGIGTTYRYIEKED